MSPFKPGMLWEGLNNLQFPRSKPDSGKPTVRDCRGDTGNVVLHRGNARACFLPDSIAMWNLKEAGGKIPTQGTQMSSGIRCVDESA